MKHIYKLLIITVLLPLAALAAKETGSLKTSNIKFNRIGSNVQLSADSCSTRCGSAATGRSTSRP